MTACARHVSTPWLQEGPTHDRGLYYRAFDEFWDLSHSPLAVGLAFSFSVTVLEIHNEQVG